MYCLNYTYYVCAMKDLTQIIKVIQKLFHEFSEIRNYPIQHIFVHIETKGNTTKRAYF